MIVMPAMAEAQEASWNGLLDLYEVHPTDWTLIGGQLVHLHCAERGFAPLRPTDDADAVVNARVAEVLGAVTESLHGIKFLPDQASADGVQHRWTRGAAVIDVLIPDGMGEKADTRPSVTGFPTIAAPGGTQALRRTEVVEVRVGGREGRLPRTNLVGALVLKAKARLDTVASGRDRHVDDFAVLVGMLGAKDLRDAEFSRGERRTLRKMVEVTTSSDRAMGLVPEIGNRMARLTTHLA